MSTVLTGLATHQIYIKDITALIIQVYYIINIQMKAQLTTTGQSTHLCTHISKLTKKNIQALLLHDYKPICTGCKCKISNNANIPKNQNNTMQNSFLINKCIQFNLCPHCGALFCVQGHCVLQHDPTHIFFVLARIVQNPPQSLLEKQNQTVYKQFTQAYSIKCRECHEDISHQVSANMEQVQKEEPLKKLVRFSEFVQQSLTNHSKFAKYITSKFQEYQQIGSDSLDLSVFGLVNLGNTCYLNSNLQVLYYTDALRQLYQTAKNTNNQFLISRIPQKRKQTQYFYSDILEKQQEQNWHIVKNDKKKMKKQVNRFNGYTGEKFVQGGVVLNWEFNKTFTEFMNDIKSLLSAQNDNMLVYEPASILKKLGEFNKKYKYSQEQDTQQLFVYIIDILSQGEMLQYLSLPANSSKKDRYKKIQSLIGRQKLTSVQQIFGSYLVSHIVCLGCKKESWVVDFTYHYPVSIQNKTKYAQQTMKGDLNTPISSIKYPKNLYFPSEPPSAQQSSSILDQMFQPQRLSYKENYYKCEDCMSLSGMKKFYIVDEPQVLVISLKRFQHGTSMIGKGKINKFVKFDQMINISPYMLREEDQLRQDRQGNLNRNIYELYALIVHKGENISTGHYICFVKLDKQDQQNKQKVGKSKWYQFSDQKVRKVAQKQVFKQEAYMLFYKKTRQNIK